MVHIDIAPVVPRYPLVGVGVFIFDLKGRMLIGKRLSKYGKGFYSLPGGKVDWNEPVKLAALRETEEETGLICENLKQIGYCDEIHPEYDMHFVTLYWAAQTRHPELMFNVEPEKCEDWLWVYPDTAREYDPLWTPLASFMQTLDFRKGVEDYSPKGWA